MNEFVFTLTYALATDDRDPDDVVERLGAAGCTDALVGTGKPGVVALEFARDAETAEAAVQSAIADIRVAIPSATLVDLSPKNHNIF